jgi:hypothetical protein
MYGEFARPGAQPEPVSGIPYGSDRPREPDRPIAQYPLQRVNGAIGPARERSAERTEPLILDLLRPLDRPDRRYRLFPGAGWDGPAALAYTVDVDGIPPFDVVPRVGLAGERIPGGFDMRAIGVWLSLPAHAVHMARSSRPIDGEWCSLWETDHRHVHQVVAAPDDADTTVAVRAVVEAVRAGEDRAAAIRRLQSRIGPSTGPADATFETRESGRHVFETTTLPVGRLLAANRDLAAHYIELVAAPDPSAPDTAAFLARLLDAADAGDDLELIGWSAGLPEGAGRVLALFGICTAPGPVLSLTDPGPTPSAT